MWLDEEAKMGLILSVYYKFFGLRGSFWWFFAKNLENIKNHRLNYRLFGKLLFKQTNPLSTNSRYYQLQWPPWGGVIQKAHTTKCLDKKCHWHGAPKDLYKKTSLTGGPNRQWCWIWSLRVNKYHPPTYTPPHWLHILPPSLHFTSHFRWGMCWILTLATALLCWLFLPGMQHKMSHRWGPDRGRGSQNCSGRTQGSWKPSLPALFSSLKFVCMWINIADQFYLYFIS